MTVMVGEVVIVLVENGEVVTRLARGRLAQIRLIPIISQKRLANRETIKSLCCNHLRKLEGL